MPRSAQDGEVRVAVSLTLENPANDAKVVGSVEAGSARGIRVSM